MIVRLRRTSPRLVVSVGTVILSQLYIRRLFEPERLEIWYGALVESEGGVLLNAEDVSEKTWQFAVPSIASSYMLYLLSSTLLNPRKMIIRVEGRTRKDIPAHVTMFLSGSVYGDVEFDVMSTSSVKSISELFASDPYTRENLVATAVLAGRRLRNHVRYIVVGDSPDAQLYMNHWLVFYSTTVPELYKFIGRTLSVLHPGSVKPGEYPVLDTEKMISLAKQHGVSLVVSGSEVLFVSSSLDLTQEFIRSLLSIEAS